MANPKPHPVDYNIPLPNHFFTNVYFMSCFVKEHEAYFKAVNFDVLPRRHTWMGLPLLGMKESQHRGLVLSNLAWATTQANRFLSPEEKEALLPSWGRQKLVLAYVNPCALLSCTFFTLRGRHTYRFPLYQPKFTRFNPDYFPPLRGGLARTLWHAVRFGSYFVPNMLGAMFVASWVIGQQKKKVRDSGNPVLENFFRDCDASTHAHPKGKQEDADQWLGQRYEEMFPDYGVVKDKEGQPLRRRISRMTFARYLDGLAAQSTGRFTMEQDGSSSGEVWFTEEPQNSETKSADEP